jgi:hypothetical protein
MIDCLMNQRWFQETYWIQLCVQLKTSAHDHSPLSCRVVTYDERVVCVCAAVCGVCGVCALFLCNVSTQITS